MRGINKINVYVSGRKIPSSAYIQLTDKTIEFKQTLPVGTHVLIESERIIED